MLSSFHFGENAMLDAKPSYISSTRSDINLFDSNNDICFTIINAHQSPIFSIVPISSTHFLSAGGSETDSTIKLWVINSDKPLMIYEGHPGGVSGLDVLSSSNFVSCGANDNKIAFWAVNRSAPLARSHSRVWRPQNIQFLRETSEEGPRLLVRNTFITGMPQSEEVIPIGSFVKPVIMKQYSTGRHKFE